MVKAEETLAGIGILKHLPHRDLETLAGRCQWRRYGPIKWGRKY